MSKSTKLSDLQLVLLSTAAARENGALLPIAKSLGTLDQRIRNSLAGLVKRRLVEEQGAGLNDPVWRQDDNGRYCLFISPHGLAALNIGEEAEPAPDPTSKQAPQDIKLNTQHPRQGSKTAQLTDLLGRDEGTTLSAICEVTGWLPHSARAALTGLRKRGHAIVSERPESGERLYRIARGDS